MSNLTTLPVKNTKKNRAAKHKARLIHMTVSYELYFDAIGCHEVDAYDIVQGINDMKQEKVGYDALDYLTLNTNDYLS